MKLNTKPLKDVEIGLPVLAAGTYFCRIRSKKIEPNAAKTGSNLVLQCQILDDNLVKADGEQIENRGQCVYTRWIGLVATDKYDPNTAIKELAIASGRDKDSEDDFGVDDIAEYMKVVLAVRPAGADKNGIMRDESNDIKRFQFIKPEDNFTPPAIK